MPESVKRRGSSGPTIGAIERCSDSGRGRHRSLEVSLRGRLRGLVAQDRSRGAQARHGAHVPDAGVWSPGRRVVARRVRREIHRPAPGGGDRPHVVVALAVRRERDARAVRRPRRLGVVGLAHHERVRVGPVGRHRPDVRGAAVRSRSACRRAGAPSGAQSASSSLPARFVDILREVGPVRPHDVDLAVGVVGPRERDQGAVRRPRRKAVVVVRAGQAARAGPIGADDPDVAVPVHRALNAMRLPSGDHAGS